MHLNVVKRFKYTFSVYYLRLMMAKTHSATVKVIKDGRVTIPQEIREVEGINEGDFIKITIEKIERRSHQ